MLLPMLLLVLVLVLVLVRLRLLLRVWRKVGRYNMSGWRV